MKLESWGQVAASSQTISVQVSDTQMRLKVERWRTIDREENEALSELLSSYFAMSEFHKK